MLVKNFHDLPQELQCEEVRPYFEILNQRRTSLLLFLSIIIFALTINCIETIVKAVKYSRQ